MSNTDSSHPFAAPYGGIWCDCESRLDIVKKSEDCIWLRRVLALPDLQKTVRAAAVRRMPKIENQRLQRTENPYTIKRATLLKLAHYIVNAEANGNNFAAAAKEAGMDHRAAFDLQRTLVRHMVEDDL